MWAYIQSVWQPPLIMSNHVVNARLKAAQLVFGEDAEKLPHAELVASFAAWGAPALSEDMCDFGECSIFTLDFSLSRLAHRRIDLDAWRVC